MTSFIHHPYYTLFVLEVPDNWSLGKYYNIPLSKMLATIDTSLKRGYSIGWGGDITDSGFAWRLGIADTQNDADEISERMRQGEFDSYRTTDDHGMHIVGKAIDKYRESYYLTKNSWGENKGVCCETAGVKTIKL